jgi:hypothetical protein
MNEEMNAIQEGAARRGVQPVWRLTIGIQGFSNTRQSDSSLLEQPPKPSIECLRHLSRV